MKENLIGLGVVAGIFGFICLVGFGLRSCSSTVNQHVYGQLRSECESKGRVFVIVLGRASEPTKKLCLDKSMVME